MTDIFMPGIIMVVAYVVLPPGREGSRWSALMGTFAWLGMVLLVLNAVIIINRSLS